VALALVNSRVLLPAGVTDAAVAYCSTAARRWIRSPRSAPLWTKCFLPTLISDDLDVVERAIGAVDQAIHDAQVLHGFVGENRCNRSEC